MSYADLIHRYFGHAAFIHFAFEVYFIFQAFGHADVPRVTAQVFNRYEIVFNSYQIDSFQL